MSISNNPQKRNVLRGAIPALYALAIVISIFAGGLIWVLIVGAVLSSFAYTLIARGRPSGGGGRQRNRNRNRGQDSSL